VVVAAATAIAVNLAVDDAPSAWEGAALVTATDALTVDLEDGSQLELSARTRVEVKESTATAIRVDLARGRVSCNVAPNRQRDFEVFARGVRVRVTGTRFDVEVSDDQGRVRVRVERGTVEVTPPGSAAGLRVLSAGEEWSLDARLAESAKTALAEAPRFEQSSGAEAARSLARETAHGVRAPATATKSGPHDSDKPATPESIKPEVLTSRDLLDQGNAARRAGDASAAAKAYEALLADYPSDPRAGLAAFELGRLRMDRLGNLQGAVQALRQAVTLAPGSAFREDAMARLVHAYGAMGAGAPCRSAKKAYLDAYPKGVHATALANKCGSP
jgi:TolA-binding protein